MRRLLLVLALIGPAMWSGPVLAQDMEKGKSAWLMHDYATALREIRPLADQGNAEAQTILGIWYELGTGVPQDFAAAMKWYSLAAQQGYADAQYLIGNMYYSGTGVLEDYAEAVTWYRLAAEQGDPASQFFLGSMYRDGEGVTPNSVLAHMWMNIAASLASGKTREIARDARVKIALSMTPDQIAQAQQLARECVARSYKGC